MAALLLTLGVGIFTYVHHITDGLVVTNMTDHVPWGIGIANFIYFVGVAAGAAVLVVPAYAFKRKDIKEVVILGEMLAAVAIVVCLMCIVTDIGRPERMLHLFTALNLPSSLLGWDVVVFQGYLLMNIYIPWYLLYKWYLNEKPKDLLYVPLVFLSMFWAVSIHTVTAFLLAGLGGRHFWASALLAPRFLISAAASAPAIIILILAAVRRFTDLPVKKSVFDYLKTVLRVSIPANLFLVGCEVFQEFYSGSLHSAAAKYLYFGLHGNDMLPKFIWTAIIFNITALVIVSVKKLRDNQLIMYGACVLAVVGVWLEKGMGLLFPGFTPGPLGEIHEYAPNAGEIIVLLAVLALGGLMFTVMAKVAIAVQVGRLRIDKPDGKPEEVAEEPLAEPAAGE